MKPGRHRNALALFAMVASFLLVLIVRDNAEMYPMDAETGINLPKSVGAWTRLSGLRQVSADTIFQYMDGAGELYVGYRFKRLDVIGYRAAEDEEILVELYWMGSSDDAFGLLSGDWGGEVVDLGQSVSGSRVPYADKRALYGAGLLRIWSDDLYARVLASRETEPSRKAVLQLGRAIAAGRRNPPPPKLLSALPSQGSPAIKLRKDRVCYFRSYLVLNSIYFLSPTNILDLGLATEAVTAAYAGGEGRRGAQLVLVRYPDPVDARKALDHFEKTYLPDKKLKPTQQSAQGDSRLWKIEDGWIGYRQDGRNVTLVFESPGRESAALLIDGASKQLKTLEVSHE